MSDTVAVPERMRHLDRDRRGYPIPWGVYRDHDGDPHFTINDENARLRMLREDLCSICGHKLLRGRWFVGGPLSAYHASGTYIDPPMHAECARYALQVCPYLSAPHYQKMIGDRTVKAKGAGPVLIDSTVIPGRPHLFVAVLATRQTLHRSGAQIYVTPQRPYLNVEYWRCGERLSDSDGALVVAAALREGVE